MDDQFDIFAEEEQPKNNKKTLIIGAVVFGLLCCCCALIAGVWLWNNGDQLIQQLSSVPPSVMPLL